MMKGILTQALMLWAAIVLAQIVTAIRSFRADRSLSLYLASEVAFAVAGFAAMLSNNLHLYARAYGYAGLWDDVATATLLLMWLNELRQRGRPRRSGILIPSLAIAVAGAVAVKISAVPASELRGYFWGATHAVGHIVWLWLSLIIVLVPLYCACTMARPDRPLSLKLLGLAVYICAHSGLVDFYVAGAISHIPFLKALSDLIYLVPLLLWNLAMPREAAVLEPAVIAQRELAL